MQYNQDSLFNRVDVDRRISEERFLDNLMKRCHIDGSPTFPTHDLITTFCRINEKGLVVPKNTKCIFLRFQPIIGVDELTYKFFIMHRKLFQYAIKQLCPFITVCDIEGKDASYDIARQFYTIDEQFNFVHLGLRGQVTKSSTHLYVTEVIRSETGRVEEFKCRSAKTGVTFRMNSDDNLLHKIGVLADHPKTVTLSNKYKTLMRPHSSACSTYSALLLLVDNEHFYIMDTVLCNVVYRCATRQDLLKKCHRLLNKGFEIAYCKEDTKRIPGRIIDVLTGIAKMPDYLTKVLRFVASKWAPGMRDEMFRKQAIVDFINKKKTSGGE